MSIPSDKEIQKATANILKDCDIATTTLKIIRKQLEEKFGCSLSEKKDLILESFDSFINQNAHLVQYNEIVEQENQVEEEEEPIVEAPKKKKGDLHYDLYRIYNPF